MGAAMMEYRLNENTDCYRVNNKIDKKANINKLRPSGLGGEQ